MTYLIKSESKDLSSNKISRKVVYGGVFATLVLVGIGLGLGIGLKEPKRVPSSSHILSEPV